jgi:Cu(I)/Ag(I) efflux system membrane protein CusA/SilA
MALPIFGGMLLTIITVFVVPVIYCWEKEVAFKKRLRSTS